MGSETRQIKVAKSTNDEIHNLSDYINELSQVIEENSIFDKISKEEYVNIGKIAAKLPDRAFLVPLNLGIMLDNYQDVDSSYLKTPKWIDDLYTRIEYLEKVLTDNNIDFD